MTMTLEHISHDLRAYSAESGTRLERGECAEIADAIDAAIRERDELRTGRDAWAEQHASRVLELVAARERAVKAEAELAALKARIAEAQVYTCEADIISGRDGDYISAVLTHDDPAFQYPDIDGKRVRLVVEN